MCGTTHGHEEPLLRTAALCVLVSPIILMMLMLGSVAPWMLLLFLGQQLPLSAASVRSKPRGADRRSSALPAVGTFTVKDKMRCTWAVRPEGASVRLQVDCENPEARVKGGITELKCEYSAKPQYCPGYQSDIRRFWKQVPRALKRLQDKVCDERALVKASMCKGAPRNAHFKVDMSTVMTAAQSGDLEDTPPPPTPPTTTTTRSTTTSTSTTSTVRSTTCSGRADHGQRAEEYCSSSWASVCSFFFSVLQNDC